MPELNVVLSAAELRHLGTLVGIPLTTISPLAGPADGPADPAHLVAAGILATDASIAPLALPAVRVLASARAYAGVVLRDSGTFEHVVYFDGHDKVALTSETGGFRLQDPAPVMGDLLRATLGEGVAVGVALDEVFTATEAAVLLAVLDLRRRQLLQGVLDDRDAAATPIERSAIAAWLARPATASQWIAPLLRETAGAAVDPASLDAAVRSLTARAALVASGSSVVAGTAVEALAPRFLIIRMLLRARAGRIFDDGRVVTADLHVAQSAGLQHLLWETDVSGRVHLQCVTPTGLASTIEHFLTDADALADFTPAPQPTPAATAAPAVAPAPPVTGPRFCPQCGSPTVPGARFCRSCGRQLLA